MCRGSIVSEIAECTDMIGVLTRCLNSKTVAYRVKTGDVLNTKLNKDEGLIAKEDIENSIRELQIHVDSLVYSFEEA